MTAATALNYCKIRQQHLCLDFAFIFSNRLIDLTSLKTSYSIIL